MIKILYVIGDSGYKGKWREFRWSLRSLEKYAKGSDGKVNIEPVVVGIAPSWFRGDVLPLEEPEGESKTRRIANKVIAACKTELVTGEFMFSADDHFLTSDIDFTKAPQFYKRSELPDALPYFGIHTEYMDSLIAARHILLGRKMPIIDFSQHFNTFFHADDWPLVATMERESAWIIEGWAGANFHPLFGNAWVMRNKGSAARKLEWRLDRKFPSDTKSLMTGGYVGYISGFSIGDEAFEEEGFEDWMNALYNVKSRWEK